MVNSHTDDLHELVSSMDRNERGYFKRWAKVHVDDPAYLQLFDAIARQRRHDEAKLRRKFKSQPWARQFAVAKHQLHQNVLRCLRAYHERNVQGLEMSALADQASLLMARGLTRQALTQVDKLEARAQEMDTAHRQLLAQELRSRLAFYLQAPVRQQQVGHALRQMNAAASRILRELPMYEYYFQVFEAMQVSRVGAHQQAHGQEHSPIASPYREEEVASLGFRSQMLYHTTETFQAFLAMDMSHAAKHALALVQKYEEHPSYLLLNANAYLGAVANYFLCSERLAEHPDYPAYERKVRQLVARVPKAAASAFNFLCLYGINHLLRARKYAQVPAYADWLLQEIPAHGRGMNAAQMLGVRFMTGLGLWFAGEGARAVQLLNSLFTDYGPEVRSDLQLKARLALLVLHLERGNTDVLDSQLRNLRRLSVQEGTLSEAELAFLRHFGKVIGQPEGKARLQALQRMKKAMREARQEGEEKEYSNLRLADWVESKLAGMEFHLWLAAQG